MIKINEIGFIGYPDSDGNYVMIHQRKPAGRN